MPEIININIGQAGCTLATSFWKQICHEEDIDFNGMPLKVEDEVRHGTFFQQNSLGQHIAQQILIDSEEDVIDEILLGSMGNMLGNFTIAGKEDSSNCYARGKFKVAKEIRGDSMTNIRRLSEVVGHLDQFQFFYSTCGGTGSGFTTSLLISLSDIFNKVPITSHAVMPANENQDVVTEPYNTVLCQAETHNLIHCKYCYHNSALYELLDPIIRQEGRVTKLDLSPTFADMNHLVSLVPCGVSAGGRFEAGDCMKQMNINLVPFPKLNIIAPAIVPLYHNKSRVPVNQHTLITEAFLSNSELCDIDTFEGRYIAVFLMYRGNVRMPFNNHKFVRNSIDFVPWCPTGIKYEICKRGITHEPDNAFLSEPERGLIKISNHTTILTQIVNKIMQRYEKLLERRAFIHWYVQEGMEEGEFQNASESLQGALDEVDTILNKAADFNGDDDE